MEKPELIVNWLRTYANNAKMDGYVIGISGGVDSALTSTLCALTELETAIVIMPIHQPQEHTERGLSHAHWLTRLPNVKVINIPLTRGFDEFIWCLPKSVTPLAAANSRARLRMAALYAVANSQNLLVAGTGNKVEDFGLGFFTKFGDGGVDVSPIGSLTKTEVWEMAKTLGINQKIIDATPTDGLWNDDRSDEDQIGASYKEIEEAMRYLEFGSNEHLTERQHQVLRIYETFHLKNRHKMKMPPIFKFEF